MIVPYVTVLDTSKAFDRVHYVKLISILLSKNIPKIVVRLYFDSYMRQGSIFEKGTYWVGTLEKTFKIIILSITFNNI